MTKEEFWNNIIISDEEKQKSVFFLSNRGIIEHDNVRLYLESLTGRTVKYSEIATAFRYDKRIRRVLFKFIGMIEEKIRAYISDKYFDDPGKLNMSKVLSTRFKKEGDLWTAVSSIRFSLLIEQYFLLDTEEQKEIFPQREYNRQDFYKDLDALVQLRNDVSHNRFILDSSRLKPCSIGDHTGSLWENIMNLRLFLPVLAQGQFLKEIEDCQNPTGETYKNQTDWEIIDKYTIQIAKCK